MTGVHWRHLGRKIKVFSELKYLQGCFKNVCVTVGHSFMTNEDLAADM